MQELSRYAVGLDIGTTTVRCVVGHVDAGAQTPTIIGIAATKNSGMRKGIVVNLVSTAQAIDKALEDAERMSGHQIEAATVSVNGSHILGMTSRGVIAVGTQGHEINEDDLARVEEAATVVQLPANREILDVTPRGYQLDGQENIKDPIGMTGVRLEVDAHVITALAPHMKNLLKANEMTHTQVNRAVPAGLAAARAVLSEQQMENGVLLVDIGGTTTNIAVYEEGDLQHIAVLPVGGVNITNDLAIGLKTDLDIAEELKLKHAIAMPSLRKAGETVLSVKLEKQSHEFPASEVDMIVDARLEELFEYINKELKSIGRAAKLPGGVVLTGAGAQLKGIDDYARESLQLAVRIGHPTGFSGVAENIQEPQFATAAGLMLLDLEGAGAHAQRETSKTQQANAALGSFSKKISGLFNKFRS
ncbi:MAG TPA: cell division protein FtsA [Verrucomicrobiae bacterium]|nr:cell division protein FtsA [Verrucomicrobiae bacterium]